MRISIYIILLCVCIIYGMPGAQANFDVQKKTIINDIYKLIPNRKTITHTEVPRGIVLSVAQTEMFNGESTNISENGKLLLKNIANLLEQFSNNCTIEVHSPPGSINGICETGWEVSIIRANIIARYLITEIGIDKDRIFSIGFGEMMPFFGNISQESFPDNRVDFVIYDYTVGK